MPLAICLRSIVLPALGGDTISARWPLPSGLTRLIRRCERFLGSVSRLISSIGWIGVSASKCGRRLAASGSTPLTESTRTRPQYFSPSLGCADDAADAVAGAQAGAAHLAGRHVNVVRRGHQPAAAQEAVAVVDDIEDAGHEDLAALLDLALHDPLDEIVLAHGLGVVDVEVAADLDQLVEVL